MVALVERRPDGLTGRREVYKVPKRTVFVVQNIIAKHVISNTVVHSYGGSCYQSVRFLSQIKCTLIEHKKCTLDQLTGIKNICGVRTITCVGTNTVESMWRMIRRRICYKYKCP